MKRALRVFGMAAVAVAATVLVGSAQGQEMEIPKPRPEHEILKKDVGVWDATVESSMSPEGKATVTKGVETNTLFDGGLWLVQDFKGEFFGTPFQGHGVTGYDPAKKKYVGTWVDSMTMGLSKVEGTYDPKTKTMNASMESPAPDGSMMKMRSTSEWKDENTRVFTMYASASKDKEMAVMKITYKRRPATTK
jgi:hypothetical protein